MEEEIAQAFLPALFEGVGDGAPGRDITRLPVKQAGMALPDPTRTAPENWQAGDPSLWYAVSQSPKQSQHKGLPQRLLHRAKGVANARGDPLHECPLLLE